MENKKFETVGKIGFNEHSGYLWHEVVGDNDENSLGQFLDSLEVGTKVKVYAEVIED